LTRIALVGILEVVSYCGRLTVPVVGMIFTV